MPEQSLPGTGMRPGLALLLATLCPPLLPGRAIARSAGQGGIPLAPPAATANPAVPRVEFEPPFVGTFPAGAPVRIILAHREDGALAAMAAAYTLDFPAGLSLYSDFARTQRIPSGALLATEITGYDTLWAAVAPESAADQTYILSLSSSPRTLSLTFLTVPSALRIRVGTDGQAALGVPRRDALGRKGAARGLSLPPLPEISKNSN